ncbi:MAG TPA: hypothetical protein PKW14_07830 [Bacteroidota bacterium]|nr:hypothetical protein [Bacteroidota bacterium]
MNINITSKSLSKKFLKKSGEFILQNIETKPDKILVSGKELFPAKSKIKSKLEENEFLFDKSRKIVIFKIPNIYDKLSIKIINETNQN